MLRPAGNSDREEKKQLERQKRRLVKDLGQILAERDVAIWLDTPNIRLGSRRPNDLLGTPDQQQMVDLVEAVKLGLPT